MKISVFGLGYVGTVTAACFAREGHHVTGVDVQAIKVDLINSGHSPVIEDQIDELVHSAVAAGRLRATLDTAMAIQSSELAIICVGTPSLADGSLDNRFVLQVASDIGNQLREKKSFLHIVLRSTVVPGTLRNLIIPALEQASGRTIGDGYDIVFHPEFLREGTSVYDFYNPPKIVVGEERSGSSEVVLELYSSEIQAPRVICSIEEAEMVKYCDNLFHAVKVTFANEIGQFCLSQGINSQRVMDIFCEDTKLNLSPKYLAPGFVFGGSCLPKDLHAFLSVAHAQKLKLSMLENVIASNQWQFERALGIILSTGVSKIGFYGIAFKPGTDDLRGSPLVELAERLLGKGKHLTIYDQMVQIARLMGGNKSYAEQILPHLANLLTDQLEALLTCEMVLVGHPAPFTNIEHWTKNGITVLDLTGKYSRAKINRLICIV